MKKSETLRIDDPRRHPRIRGLYLVSYTNREKGVQKFPVSLGRTLDLSKSGIRLEVFQEIQQDSEMEVEIGIREDNIVLKGRVVRVDEHPHGKSREIGIEFLEASDILEKELAI